MPVRFGFYLALFWLFGGARIDLTFLPRFLRSGTRLARYSGKTKFRALTLIRQSLRHRSGLAPKPRFHSDGAFGRLLVVAQISGFGRFSRFAGHPKSLKSARCSAQSRAACLVETKFDSPWPCLSGLGSIWHFSGFLGGRGVISHCCLGTRAQEPV